MNVDKTYNIPSSDSRQTSLPAGSDHDEARRLTRLFFDGMTDLDQEQRLYVYYARRDVAPDLAGYAPMMRWMAEGCPPACHKDSRRRSWRRIARVAAAVAGVLLVGGSVLTTLDARGDLDTTRRCYGSSYLVAGGERVTDLTEVLVSMEMASDQIDDMLIDCNYIPAQ